MNSSVTRTSSVLLLLALGGCPKEVLVSADLEYGLRDGKEMRGLLNEWRDAERNNTFELKVGGSEAPEGWEPMLTFVHASDVQIRDSGIHYLHDERQRHIADHFSGGTERHADLDGNDEVPYLALIGSINALPEAERPQFLLHTGDAIDVGCWGELYTFMGISNLLRIAWFGAVGNHDVLLFGNFTQNHLKLKFEKGASNAPGVFLSQSRKEFLDIHGSNELNIEHFPEIETHIPTEEFTPVGSTSYRHGFDHTHYDVSPESDLAPAATQYSILVHEKVRLIVLDTTVPDERIKKFREGEVPGTGAGGELDEDQLGWLQRELDGARDRKEWVLVAAHHPISKKSSSASKWTVVKTTPPSLKDRLAKHPQVIAYFAGHTHYPYIKTHEKPSGGVLAEVVAPSVHEHPQQAFKVTLLKKDSRLGLLVQPIAGRIADGPLRTRLETACRGAQREAGTENPCWKDDKDTARFIELR